MGSPGRGGRSTPGKGPQSRKTLQKEVAEDEGPKKKETWKEWFDRKKIEREERYWEIQDLLDIMAEEEEYDWENLDEYGNPKRRSFLCPAKIRRNQRYVLIVYWDPLLDAVEYVPAMIRKFCRIFLFTPFFGLIGATSWLGYSMYLNSVHVKSTCEIKAMPEGFETQGRIKIEVVGTYDVLRRYPPTTDRSMLGGIAEQSCEVRVPCESMSWGDSAAYSDDDCAEFATFNWGQQITCYFHQDDPAGWHGKRLYCLNQPSDLEQETFACLATLALVLLCVTVYLYIRWKRIQQEIEDEKYLSHMEKQAEEEKNARQSIESKDVETLKEHLDQRQSIKEAKRKAKQEAYENEQIDAIDDDSDDSD